MDTALLVLGWSAFALAVVTGLALNLLGLFGNWIILGALGLAWLAYGMAPFGWAGIAAIVALAVLGEILETLFAGLGAKTFGGSKGGMVAALVGTLLGAVAGSGLIPIPIVGTLVGAFAGAFAGAALYEYLQQDATVKQSIWIGTGAALGKLGGIFAKFSCGLVMLAVAWATWS
jgi:uncharacterized protein YqgC (DUF456 family)